MSKLTFKCESCGHDKLLRIEVGVRKTLLEELNTGGNHVESTGFTEFDQEDHSEQSFQCANDECRQTIYRGNGEDVEDRIDCDNELSEYLKANMEQ